MIREERKKKFNEYFILFEKQPELEKKEFDCALKELTAHVDLVEKSLSEANKGPEREIIDSLNLSGKEARRDPNRAWNPYTSRGTTSMIGSTASRNVSRTVNWPPASRYQDCIWFCPLIASLLN